MTDFPSHSFTTKEVPAMTSDRAGSPMTDTSKTAIAAVVERLRAQAASLEADLIGVDGIQLVESDTMREAASLISALEAERDGLRVQVALANDPAYLATAIDKVGMVDKEWKTRAEKAEAERDEARKLANRYAWERDKAREERDAAEHRSESFWKPLNAKTVARAVAAEAQVATLQGKLEERDEWLRFIARWAWDKTGPADERLSVIQYFPPVKAARPEPLSTLRETTDA